MKLFTSLFVLAVLASSQVQAKNISPFSIQDDIAEYLEALKVIVNNGIDSAQKAFDDAQDRLRSGIDALIELDTGLMQKGVQPLIDLVEEQKKQAIADGRDISGCESLQEELNNVLPDASAELKSRIGDIVDDVTRKMDDEFEKARDLASIIDTLEDEIRNCNSIFCWPGILSEVLEYTASVPITIAKIVRDEALLGEEAVNDAKELGLKLNGLAIEKATELSKETIDCFLAAPTRRPTSSTTQRPTTTTSATTEADRTTTEGTEWTTDASTATTEVDWTTTQTATTED